MPGENDLTYNLSISGNTLTFMDSNGRTGSVDLPLDNDRAYSLNLVYNSTGQVLQLINDLEEVVDEISMPVVSYRLRLNDDGDITLEGGDGINDTVSVQVNIDDAQTESIQDLVAQMFTDAGVEYNDENGTLELPNEIETSNRDPNSDSETDNRPEGSLWVNLT